ncbi:MAG: Integrase [uncultured Rubrobacteraceae bacterium]|uniref:Integrase n=1 Tax=uncultured Rubrobacteraceae bacterium TaxID=349277 RepID=A0A6J4RGJ6_9ACTN|nr:MAG: Integrase [uncultured Rubrobacteraceae bacterium]
MARKRERGNGDVWPRKYKQGKIIGYRASYWLDKPSGPKRRYVSGKNKGETRTALSKAKAGKEDGFVLDASATTLGDYLDGWLEDTRGTVRQRTWERYEQIVHVHIKPTLGRAKLKTLNPAQVRALYRERLAGGSSPRTVQYVHVTLHKALEQAQGDGLVARNVAKGIKAPRPKKKEIVPLTPDQARAFLEAARGDRFEALFVLALQCGLREGELLGLRWDDVDLEDGTLRVRRTLSETRDGPIFEPPKNGKGRNVPLTGAAAEALRDHLARQMREIGDEYQDKGLVFASQTGKTMSASNVVNRHFRPLLQRAGLPRVRLHDLRHTCATLLLIKGVHPKYVQELLGHANISITLDTYSHVIPGMGNQTMDAMEEIFS